jgi:adenylosuccinate synthase
MNQAIIVHDCLFGDCGKGATVDYLASKYKGSKVIRHAGGPQCGHNVVVYGEHHCFSSFGSGFLSDAPTFILDTVVVNPLSMDNELSFLEKLTGWHYKTIGANVYIHEDCLVITPYHVAANRMEERKLKHGSCGSGCWKTMEYAQKHTPLRVKDLNNPARLIELLKEIQANIRAEFTEADKFDDEFVQLLYSENALKRLATYYPEWYARYTIVNEDCMLASLSEGTLIFEGNQGTLLDQNIGFFPHVSADCTYNNALNALKKSGFSGKVTKLGVLRSYSTRHGNGPLPLGKSVSLKGERNQTHNWQGDFRSAPFNSLLAGYSLLAQPVDKLVISCLDNDPYDHYLTTDFETSEAFSKIPTCIADQERLGCALINAPFYKTDFTKNFWRRAAQIGEILSLPIAGGSIGPERADRLITL